VRTVTLIVAAGSSASPQLSVRYRLTNPDTEPPALGSSISFQSDANGRIVARRILSDPSNNRYFGYEALLDPQTERGSYLVGFRDLDPQAVNVPAGELQSPAMYPPPRVMRKGDTISVDVGPVGINGDTNDRIVDDVLLTPLQPRTQAQATWETDSVPARRYSRSVQLELHQRGIEPSQPPPSVTHVVQPKGTSPQARLPIPPPIGGSPRMFTAADAELWIVNPSVTLNGGVAGAPGAVNAAHGRLIFLYLPGKGRYILSLVPRPELGFTRAGEVNGGFLKWTADGDAFSVDSPYPIARGGGSYFVYELHDPDWQAAPTRRSPNGILLGSVGPEEIAALQKDTAK